MLPGHTWQCQGEPRAPFTSEGSLLSPGPLLIHVYRSQSGRDHKGEQRSRRTGFYYLWHVHCSIVHVSIDASVVIFLASSRLWNSFLWYVSFRLVPTLVDFSALLGLIHGLFQVGSHFIGGLTSFILVCSVVLGPPYPVYASRVRRSRHSLRCWIRFPALARLVLRTALV